jgi:hypothetical protein
MQVSFIQKSIVVAFGAVALLGATAGAGQAWTLTENAVVSPGADAAQLITGNVGILPTFDAAINQLTGSLVGSSPTTTPGADLFKFTLAAGGNFLAETFIPGGGGPNVGNPQLFLFDKDGVGIFANDNISAVNPQARIARFLTADTYYLGISGSDLDPRGATGGKIFRPNGTVRNTSPLDGWVNTNNVTVPGGRYGINMSFEAAKVPSPALLPGLAALGFSAIRKRKAKAAVA